MRAGTIGVISSKAARYRAALRDSEDTGEEASSEEDEATEVTQLGILTISTIHCQVKEGGDGEMDQEDMEHETQEPDTTMVTTEPGAGVGDADMVRRNLVADVLLGNLHPGF